MTNIFLYILIFLIILFLYYYNRLVVLLSRAKEAWSDIDVQLQRRHELIPNLAEVVKEYASHEKDIFEGIAKARQLAIEAQSLKSKEGAEIALDKSVRSLIAISENYPELKANENFLSLQNELKMTEDKLAFARNFYNANVKEYNISVNSFPSGIVAKLAHFSEQQFFLLN